MKLIIREYLASLRERNELDVLLPDLLSQMGLEVFSKPSIGTRQYGVDIAAFGSIDGKPEKVYLFSVKSGDIGRTDWDGNSKQSLRPSLNEILDVYIPGHLLPGHKQKPIEICICFGGNIKEEVRFNISSYQKKHTIKKKICNTKQISFSEWGGERISAYIEKYLLREELLPEDYHHLLRKSLAMLDEPSVSVKYYRQLIESLSTEEYEKSKDRLTAIRQIYLCIWILYAWCRKADNVEAAFQASEISLLHAWHLGKLHLKKKDKESALIRDTIEAIISLQTQISCYFLEKKIIPHTGHLYALSSATRSSSDLDTNLKLFDVLGRLALHGLFLSLNGSMSGKLSDGDDALRKSRGQYIDAIKKLIDNNPVLNWPYKEDQAIDISLAVLFLASDKTNNHYIRSWLSTVITRSCCSLKSGGPYPCHLNEYNELLAHPQNDKEYKEKVTQGSILYPYIAAFAAVLSFDDIYKQVQELKKEQLPHCNFQLWYPDETSEKHYYLNTDRHGATSCNIPIEENRQAYLDLIFKECEATEHFEKLSAIETSFWPIILLASRHYRLPMPIHFLRDFLDKPHREQKP